MIFVRKKIFNIKMSSHAYIALFFILYLSALVIISFDAVDAIQQWINLFIFLLTVIIVNEKNICINKNQIIKIYFDVILYVSVVVLLQYLLYNLKGIVLGNIMLLGSTRLAIGYLFNDFSFLSIYLASGLAVVLVLNKRYYLDYQFYIILIACVVTSARSGIVAFFILFVISYMFKGIIKLKKNPLIIAVSLIIIPLTSVMLFWILRKTRPDDFNLSSGRIEGYLSNLSLIAENWFFGMGLGVGNYKLYTGQAIPHNIFIQFVVQTGVVGFLLLLILLAVLTVNIYKNSKKYFSLWLLILLGAQFIPDIFHSRFIIVVIVILASKNIVNTQRLKINGD